MAAVAPMFKASLPISGRVFGEYTHGFFPCQLRPLLAEDPPVSTDLASSFADEIAAGEILVDNAQLEFGRPARGLVVKYFSIDISQDILTPQGEPRAQGNL